MMATRQAFGEGLYELMKQDERLVALTADLGESLRMLSIRDEIPERFLDTGVAEANMAGVAAGLALAGHIPIAGTFAIFLTRAFDHIRMQICQNNVHAIMVGSHGGVSNSMDGGSANALEDLAYMRALPNMTVLYPADGHEMRQALKAAVDADGPIYLRLYREPTALFTDPAEAFEIGKAKIVREGVDVSIIATGPQVAFALQAAEALAKDGIEAEVVNIHTLQPIDVDAVVATAKKTGRVVTAEDHNIHGGLFSAVSEVLAEHHPTPVTPVAVTQFGESGKYADLIAKLGIDAKGIEAAVRLGL